MKSSFFSPIKYNDASILEVAWNRMCTVLEFKFGTKLSQVQHADFYKIDF